MSRLPPHVFTLALDAQPWLACIFASLNRLTDIEWTWSIVEGAAMPGGSTKWMQPQKPRLSQDGTTEFLNALKYHPRVKVQQQASWPSKDAMVDAAMRPFTKPGVLLQVDGDELWESDQLRRIVELFEDDSELMNARFHCRFMFGPNIQTTDAGKPHEWLRAWRYNPGMKWISHEPPNLAGNLGKSLSREQTAKLGLTFDHAAYLLPKHVEMKERLYGPKYAGATEAWNRLQTNTEWPLADVGKIMPAAFKGTPVDQVFKP